MNPHGTASALDLLVPLVLAALAQGGSLVAARSGIVSRRDHAGVWNLVLLAAFLLAAATGLLLAFKFLLPDLGGILRLHRQASGVALAAGAWHGLERVRHYSATLRGWRDRLASQGVGVPHLALSVAVVALLLAAPGLAIRWRVAERSAPAPRETLAASLPSRPATEPSRVAPAPDSAPGASRGPSLRAPEATVLSRPSKAPAPGSEGVLGALRGQEPAGGYDAPKLENRSRIPEAAMLSALREVRDPEIDLDIFDLGLIRSVRVDSLANVRIDLVFTSPTCPHNGWLLDRVQDEMKESGLFASVEVHEIVGRSWRPSFLTPEGRDILLELGKW